jgi:hypothetical protein
MLWIHFLVIFVVLFLIAVIPQTTTIVRVVFMLDFLIFYTTFILAIRMVGKYRGNHRNGVILGITLLSMCFLIIAIYLLQMSFSEIGF